MKKCILTISLLIVLTACNNTNVVEETTTLKDSTSTSVDSTTIGTCTQTLNIDTIK